ncbi:MAG: hypothetical protein EXQ50_15140 [Acidobacteria bacterium]|nr:hypothetical protein [Acidobacteriota bacterium]
MRVQRLALLGASLAVILVWLAPAVAVAQAPAAAAKTWTRPQTPDGQPDLQGIWNYSTITPLERPGDQAGKQVLTDEEAEALNEDARTRNDRRPAEGSAGTYNAFWWDRGNSLGRTSLIVDPPDGRIPFTPEGEKRAQAGAVRGTDGPESRSLWERCVTGPGGLPRLSSGYNNNYRILQSRDYVVIYQEMIHEARVIPLDGRPHLGPNLRQWLGDSRGRWEGQTLVVETTNFTDKTNFRGSATALRLVERFTRTDADTIDYQFTVTDSTAWARPWTAAFPLRKTDEPVFEYACHETNYGLVGILSGARADEKAQEAARRGAN